ncbi:MAG: hypothetical protein HN509_08550, partial [Halobacteriovoraceae bacterium]|nr:hypothetical protein [Halobacteriovoraceae bacterium]
MKKVFSLWISHFSIWIYAAILAGLCSYLIIAGEFFQHWYLGFVLLVAPFYEWVVHKYVLHMDPSIQWGWLQRFFERLHRGHHKQPYDVPMIFAQWYVGATFPLQFYLLGRVCMLG